VYAIIMATEALEEKVRNDEEGKIKTLRIVSDSMSAITAIGSFTTNSGLVLECRKRLSSLRSKRKLTLQWVKGHNGDEGNELADSWAKYATTTELGFCLGTRWSLFCQYLKLGSERKLKSLSVNSGRRGGELSLRQDRLRSFSRSQMRSCLGVSLNWIGNPMEKSLGGSVDIIF
jgi:hypothetical protein